MSKTTLDIISKLNQSMNQPELHSLMKELNKSAKEDQAILERAKDALANTENKLNDSNKEKEKVIQHLSNIENAYFCRNQEKLHQIIESPPLP